MAQFGSSANSVGVRPLYSPLVPSSKKICLRLPAAINKRLTCKSQALLLMSSEPYRQSHVGIGIQGSVITTISNTGSKAKLHNHVIRIRAEGQEEPSTSNATVFNANDSSLHL